MGLEKSELKEVLFSGSPTFLNQEGELKLYRHLALRLLVRIRARIKSSLVGSFGKESLSNPTLSGNLFALELQHPTENESTIPKYVTLLDIVPS